MALTPEIELGALGAKTSSLATSLATPGNIEKMFHALDKARSDKSLEEQLKSDPQAFLEEHVGKLDGVHFHTVNENNEYTPKEADAIAQLMEGKGAPDARWVRVEIRTGIGPLCAIFCGSCDNSGGTT